MILKPYILYDLDRKSLLDLVKSETSKRKVISSSYENFKKNFRRRRYFYLARVTLAVTKTDILRGPRSLRTKHELINNNRNIWIWKINGFTNE